MAELSQDQIVDDESGLTTDEKLEKRLTEIKDVLDKINKEQVDPSEYTEILQNFTDEKKAELQELVDQVDDPLGTKTITRSTCFGYGLDLIVWQEVWMKDGAITKYGNFYTRGLQPSGIVGVGGGNQINSRLPLPDEVEFDALFYCEGIFHARPKAGQSNLAEISGSLDNYLFSSGAGVQGNLGNGSTGNVYPVYSVKTEMQSRVKKIAFATEIGTNQSTIALLEDKSVWGTGKNVSGELGRGNTTQVNTWTKITDNADDIYTGSPALWVVKGTTLYACGASEMGSLGGGSTSNMTTLTQIKTSVDVKKMKSMRYYDGSGVYAMTMLHSGNRVFGCGMNSNYQIIAADQNNKNVFTEITDGMGGSIECGDGTDFAIGLDTNVLLVENGGNTDLWVAGRGTDGYGDSASENTNNKRRKITTLDGTGWKCECPILGYGAGTMKSSFFIYNEKKKDIRAFGYNASTSSSLGCSDLAANIRSLAKLTIPIGVKQFEVSMGIAKAAGFYLCVIVDGTMYVTGSTKGGALSGVYTQLNPVVSAM